MTDNEPAAALQHWVVLPAPGWQHVDGESPPPEEIVGAWPLDRQSGGFGIFEPNPGYVPSGPEIPTDPADAAIRLALGGDESAIGEIVPLLWNAALETPVADDGTPLIRTSPDGVRCVVVTTAAVNRFRVEAPLWRRVTAGELVALLPPETDLLLNPDGPAAMRLAAGAFREGAPEGEQPAAVGSGDLVDLVDGPRARAVPPEGRFRESGPVDVVTGDVVLSQTDLDLPGWLPILLTRTHVSSYRAGGLFGGSWASTLDQRLEHHADGLRYFSPDGMVLHYPALETGVPALPLAGPRLPLTLTDSGVHVLGSRAEGRLSYFAAVPGGGDRLPLVSVEHQSGHRLTIEHDAHGMPVGLRHSAGHRVSIDIADGRVTRLRLHASDDAEPVTITRYGYDEAGNLTQVIDSAGLAYRFGYDAEQRIIGRQDRATTGYRYEYDADGRCIRATGTEDRASAVFHYDRRQRFTAVTDAAGATRAYQFNDLGQVVAVTDALGNTARFEWNHHDQLVADIDQLGGVTRREWNADGDLVAVLHPDGGRTETVHDALGRPIRLIRPDGTRHHWRYDGLGRLLSETDAAGVTTTYGYDEAERVTTVRDALGGLTLLFRDARGLLTARIDELGNRTSYELDALGRVVSAADAAGNVTRYGWTVENRLAWRTEPGGRTERWRHDGEGNCVEHVDALGQVHRAEYGAFGLMTARIAPDGARTGYDYDSELRLVSVTGPTGLMRTYDYDVAGNLVAETDSDGRTLYYRHDAAGRIVARANAVGQTITYVRDQAGEVVEETADEATTVYTRDAAGRVIATSGPGVQTSVEYDALGRVVSQTCNGATITFGYDALGRRVRRTTPVGLESVWSYDAAGRPTSLTVDGHTIALDHGASGEQTHRALGSNATLTQTWDGSRRLRSQALTTAILVDGVPRGSSVSQRRAYLYRADSAVVAVTDQLSGPREFTLDARGRVTAVEASGWTETYAYDHLGNITHTEVAETDDRPDVAVTTRIPSAVGQGPRTYTGTLIDSAGGVVYQHDAQGRVVARQVPRDGGIVEEWHYNWDSFDRLTDVLTPTDEHWRYRYDTEGRRIRKERRSVGQDGLKAGTVVERVDFVWDGDRIVEQIHTAPNSDGELVSRVTAWDFEPDGFRVLTQLERSTAVGPAAAEQDWVGERFHHVVTDLVGFPAELVAEDGSIVWHAHHTLWGRYLGGDATPPTPLRFPGQHHDDETGLHYHRHRYYDPTTGRYLSKSPLGLAPADNPYDYVVNPVISSAPSGLGVDRRHDVGPAPFGRGVAPGRTDGAAHGARRAPSLGSWACPGSQHASQAGPNTRIEAGRPAARQSVCLPAPLTSDPRYARYLGANPDAAAASTS
ncbi:RHS repeat-associated protein [Actinoalloteichus hoggarensis]|uniref:Putative deoxyribonuclease RhsC n=1 Tax=Actinoalloteichus hoggarensis TaxID=1470176 RepID=A0A221WA21_9PSEU|nr:type VII secretion system-associated protein [Actinoalloteichus hoggarensis]ASO22167.1 Putative deoxyribonuclease RhsC [Actinoalloteichus hoggarensis]MBB5923750.1 RHS repeat-associated protein [Actinoalloteichus hoggarensis]